MNAVGVIASAYGLSAGAGVVAVRNIDWLMSDKAFL